MPGKPSCGARNSFRSPSLARISTAAPDSVRFIAHRARSQSQPAPFGARVRVDQAKKREDRFFCLPSMAEKEGLEPSRRLPDLRP